MTDEQSVWIVEESVDGGPWEPTSDHYDDAQRAAIAASNTKAEDDYRRKVFAVAGNSEYRAARYVRVEGSIAQIVGTQPQGADISAPTQEG